MWHRPKGIGAANMNVLPRDPEIDANVGLSDPSDKQDVWSV